MAEVCRMTNHQVYDAVSSSVRERFFDNDRGVKFGPLEMNYFSFCFGAEISCQGLRKGVYVKIPKADLYIDGRSSIIPISEQDRQLARNEYESLSYLEQHWAAQDLRVFSPRPLCFLEEYNVIITERFYADELFQIFRNQDLKRRIKTSHDCCMMEYMGRLGIALARFHQKDIVRCEVDLKPLISKMKTLVARLESLGADAGLMDRLGMKLFTLKTDRFNTSLTTTLKGIDIRNVFVDQKGILYLLDPGKMKRDWREMDLARFLVTCRILYWGSPLFFLRIAPLKVYEEQFLGSYYGVDGGYRVLLHLCIAKELLKHWEMAYLVLSLKPWTDNIKRCMKNRYIDPFYKMQISMEMEQVR